MRIQHNILAMNAYRNYNSNTSALAKNLEKLSSGYKINRAGDDAAGLAISEKMRAQITGLNAAQKNVKDGVSLVKTAEGAMQEIQDMLNRMDYLATQSANGTYDDPVDRLNLQKEVVALKDEINRIADSANFNGIKLLDGSLDANSTANINDASAIQKLTVSDYKASGPSDAFTANYITNRPEAETKQTAAKFSVIFDDAAIAKAAAGDTTLSVTIGGTTIDVSMGSAADMTGANIATKLAGSGLKADGITIADLAAAGEDGTTADIKTAIELDAGTTQGNGTDGNYVKIDGHYYKMAVDGTNANQVNFTQVDWMGKTSGEVITPDYDVSFKAKNGTGTGTVNWQVQNPTAGKGIGASHQAQVDVDIDFSKLKDGDSLNVGDIRYTFNLFNTSASAVSTVDGNVVSTVNLGNIFKTESDLQDTSKQELAMVEIAKQMGAVVNQTTNGEITANKNNTWTVGNGGLSEGKGKLTFQSISTYDGDTNATAKHPAHIGGNANNAVCDMRTEADVMKQFFSNSKDSAASVSFELDVTKIKEGDTITVDGLTFEFTDGTAVSGKGNIAVDLSKLGLANGGTIPSYNTSDVMNALKGKIDGNLKDGTSPKYDVKFDGNKMTITSKDNTSTSDVKEERVAAKVELGASAYAGKELTLQIGDTSDTFNQMKVSIGDMHTAAMGKGKTTIDGKEVDVTKTIADIDIGNIDGAREAIGVIKNAINYVSGVRGDLGAVQNRLEHTQNNLSVMAENIQDAESTIRDTDVAEEMMAYTKNNILIQSAQAMLAQANQVPQGVLQLLG